MAVNVPNVRVIIPNKKGTSLTLLVPQYEVPLLQMLWKGSVDPNDPIRAEKIPAKGTGAARCPHTGRDRFAGMRFTRAENLASEKRRLSKKYEENPRNEAPIFDAVYPVLMFEETVQRFHPDLFGGQKADTDIAAPVDILGGEGKPVDLPEEDKEAIAAQPVSPEEQEEIADEYAPAPINDHDDHADKIADLCKLKYVEESVARKMIDAGFDSVDEVAQTDPADLASMVSGIGEKNAVKIVDHAVSLETGDGSAPIDQE